jgi:hypothetical protein
MTRDETPPLFFRGFVIAATPSAIFWSALILTLGHIY